MNDKFNEQKDILIAIKKEISLLHQQVDYLIRNEKPLELLDLDVMMNRTHTIYDLMCGVEVGNMDVKAEGDEEELPVGLEEIRGLFGIEEKEGGKELEELGLEEEENEEEKLEELEELDGREGLELEEGENEEKREEENEEAYFIEEVDDVAEEEGVHDDELSASEKRDFDNPTPAQRSVGAEPAQQSAEDEPMQLHGEDEPVQQSVENEPASDASAAPNDGNGHNLDTQSFFINFEPVEEEPAKDEEKEDKEDTSVYTTGDEIEMTIPHLDITEEAAEEVLENLEASDETAEETAEEVLEDLDNLENLEASDETAEETAEEVLEDLDNLENLENLEASDETAEETTDETADETADETTDETFDEDASEEDIVYEPVVIGDMEEKEDGGFELEAPETLGERLQHGQDPTLADKLQHSTVNSLLSAIGINDKFLFVNELFNGSMEKYNRSMANLDDLKTLNGALIYLNELRIELQWNSSNEAYKKLLELVHRKFGA